MTGSHPHQTKEYKGLKGTDPLEFTSEKGTKLSVYVGDLIDADGNPVTGDVSLKFIEIYDRSTMAVTHKTTVGRDKNGKLGELFTGGEFYIELTQKGKKLSIQPDATFHLSVPYSLTKDKKPEKMKTWSGTITSKGDLVWERINCFRGEVVPPDFDGGNMFYKNKYEAEFCEAFGWVNCDRFWDYEGEKTSVKVEVPKGFNGSNSSVYITVKDATKTLTNLQFDKEKGVFTTGENETYMVTIGLDVHVIFASVKGDEWLYATKSFTVEKDQMIKITAGDLKNGNTDEMIKAIKNLP